MQLLGRTIGVMMPGGAFQSKQFNQENEAKFQRQFDENRAFFVAIVST
jgi:hypothetical protein